MTEIQWIRVGDGVMAMWGCVWFRNLIFTKHLKCNSISSILNILEFKVAK